LPSGAGYGRRSRRATSCGPLWASCASPFPAGSRRTVSLKAEARIRRCAPGTRLRVPGGASATCRRLSGEPGAQAQADDSRARRPDAARRSRQDQAADDAGGSEDEPPALFLSLGAALRRRAALATRGATTSATTLVRCGRPVDIEAEPRLLRSVGRE